MDSTHAAEYDDDDDDAGAGATDATDAADGYVGGDTDLTGGCAGESAPRGAPLCAACRRPLKAAPSYDRMYGQAAAADAQGAHGRAPCGKREHTAHTGRCYELLHCAGLLEGEPLRCGVCGVEGQTHRRRMLSWVRPADASVCLPIVATGCRDARRAQLLALHVHAPVSTDLPAPVAALPDDELRASTADTPAPAPASAQTQKTAAAVALDMLVGNRGGGGGGGSASARGKSPTFTALDAADGGAARRRALSELSVEAQRWTSTSFNDPREALAGGLCALGTGPLRAENLRRHGVTLRSVFTSRSVTANSLLQLAPAFGDLLHLGLDKELLADRQLHGDMLSPKALVRLYGVNAEMICNEVLQGGIVGLCTLGYTADELALLEVTAPWLCANHATLTQLAAFGRVKAREWVEKLGLTPELMRTLPDYSGANVKQLWGSVEGQAMLERMQLARPADAGAQGGAHAPLSFPRLQHTPDRPAAAAAAAKPPTAGRLLYGRSAGGGW